MDRMARSKIFVDILSGVFMAALPACVYIMGIDVRNHVKGIPASIIIAILDIVPTVFGIGWLAWRYQKIGIIIYIFRNRHPYALFSLQLLLAVSVAAVTYNYLRRQ